MKPPALQVELFSTAELLRYPQNARTHSKAQVRQIANSMDEFGWTNPILLREDRKSIIAGHARLEAAALRKIRKVPCIVIAGLTDAQYRALIIADNQLAMNAGWDVDILASEIGRLKAEDYDLAVLGFDDRELERLALPVENAGLTNPDSLPEADDTEQITKPGDLWILGEHRVLCGDATSRAHVHRLLEGRKPNVMVTDPPYGVNYSPEWRERAGLNPRTRMAGKVSNDDRADWTPAWRLFPGNIAYVWHAGVYAVEVANSLAAAGFKMRAQIIWLKQHFAIGRGAYHWQHEPAWFAARPSEEEQPWHGDEHYSPDHEDAFYGVREGGTANWMADRKQSTVWMAKNLNPFGGSDEQITGHATQKPVDIMRRPILNHTSPGALVYDPFGGSGTTVIAAEMCGRQALLMELNPKYVDLTVRRWEAFTGRTAERESAAVHA